jgi:hypothetical protein
MFLAATFLALPAASPVETPPDPALFDPNAALVAPSSLAPLPLFGDDAGWASYTYIEAGFTTYDVEELDDDNVDTYYARGSLGLFSILYGFAEYENSSIDFENTDTNQVTLGAGAHFEPLSALSLYGEIGWLYNSVSSDDGDVDGTENGYRVEGGARWMALPWSGGGLEVNGALGYIDVDNYIASDENPTYWNLGARVHFLGHLSVGATYERIDVDDRLIGNARFSF